MAKWPEYRRSRTSWGINVLGSFCVEIEATNGSKGFATGFGGPPACWLTHQHFERFLIGEGAEYFRCAKRNPETNVYYFIRPPRYQQPVREDVPRLNVLWPQGSAHSRDLGH